jgi:eukaryotic-like serine/threonine-protein kinase
LLPGAPFGYVHAALPYMALNRFEEARTILQRAIDAKADNLFIHEELYSLAYLNGDADGMQREMKWAEGKPSEYLLLNDAANVAMSHGQVRKAEELWQRSAQVTERSGFKDTTANTKAIEAQVEAEIGNFAKAKELAASSSALASAQANMSGVAMAVAITGDTNRAQTIVDDLGRRFPSDTLLHQVTIPVVRALIELQRKAPEKAIESLQAVVPYELGAAQGLFPNYVRGLAYLQAKRGPEAAAEFQKMLDHRGIQPVLPEHSLAKLGIGRAYALSGDTAKARAAYQDFLALWKDADPDVPLLKEAKAEYERLK